MWRAASSGCWTTPRPPKAICGKQPRHEACRRSGWFLPGVATSPEHVGRHACADLFLDTLYYNAHTTAADALLAGLPVLTLPGASMAARVGASLVRAAGLPELVAQDLADYEYKALQLATNPADLARLKQALVPASTRACPLFDLPRRTREIEAAYAEMWRRHAAGLGPQSFRVAPIDGIGT